MMFREPIVLFLITLILASCGQQSTHNTYNTDPGTDSSIAIEIPPDSASEPAVIFADTLTLRMDSTGKIGWLGHRIKMADLQQQVQDSLMSIYLHTGKLPSRLNIQYRGTVTMGIRGAADDMIRQAQEVVINVIAVRESGMPYGQLDPKKQAVFKEKYPALFQKYY